jgi:hypothetical protein
MQALQVFKLEGRNTTKPKSWKVGTKDQPLTSTGKKTGWLYFFKHPLN